MTKRVIRIEAYGNLARPLHPARTEPPHHPGRCRTPDRPHRLPAVPGLAAKPVIDIQVSVATLDPVDPFRIPLEDLGYVYRADNPERTKRYFRERPGDPRTHIHVRKLGSFSQQFPLLLRDYLRTHPAELAPYEHLKRQFAAEHPHDGAAYTEAKVPWFWQTVRRADTWAQQTAWEPAPSDA